VPFERLGVGEDLRVGLLEKVQPPRLDSVAGLDETVAALPFGSANNLSTAIKKLGARNRVEAARLADRKGWL
jgi:hypothetical protein